MIIGLTGSIGAGKTTVSKRLCELGALILDADVFARQAVEPGSKGLDEIVRLFGPGMLRQDGTFNRAAMAAAVFADEQKRMILNGILHPLVLEKMKKSTLQSRGEQPERPVVWDVPLLIESGWAGQGDVVWLVTAERETRIARIIRRDGCTRAQAEARISAQMPDEEKRRYADEILINDGDTAQLLAQVNALYAGMIAKGAEA